MRHATFFIVCLFLLTACEPPNTVELVAQERVATDPIRMELVRGRLSEINLADFEPGGSDFEILKQPSNGILRPSGQDGLFSYQHGGASRDSDELRYQVQVDPEITLSRTLTMTFREASAGVRILAPTEGAQIRAGRIEVRYALSGLDYDHLHISLNHRNHNTIRDLTGSYFLENVPAGTHRIHAQLVDANHKAIDLPTAKAEINIVVAE